MCDSCNMCGQLVVDSCMLTLDYNGSDCGLAICQKCANMMNLRRTKDCDECDGDGEICVPLSFAESTFDGDFKHVECEACAGSGKVEDTRHRTEAIAKMKSKMKVA